MDDGRTQPLLETQMVTVTLPLEPLISMCIVHGIVIFDHRWVQVESDEASNDHNYNPSQFLPAGDEAIQKRATEGLRSSQVTTLSHLLIYSLLCD